ncbi:FAD-binding and (Fe-S)-binding domain-containing protein [Paramagnetospirillum magneticum]|uniref:D-lactate dehydrogenase (cytochrome) n=1 Tax=Paramagnetospirillum magneticum (strain ATCC 700264 / AMB-1) TaxID=342108 RepID=Q2VZN9_PARM1|nr:FAD-binding and (Fe-S)-binding domain-containing protein [Paramagnetospirillum magneticum]BAE52936.1 FAD/FMN-containing dehydrogenase [Paramagnetospirillum magneticum AMB-1]
MTRTAPDYSALLQDLTGVMPVSRLITDPLRRLAYGTDASFYRLVPQVVAEVRDEAEVKGVLAACRRHGAPVTFRAAGTSLSGQAVSDSVLMILGTGWTQAVVEDEGKRIRLQPGVIGAEANRRLAAFARKIGPDPASIDSCKIGGIAANNASGMCCGTSDNSYQTVMSMRLVLADGTLVDTGNPESVAAFRASHAELLSRLDDMGRRVRDDETLAGRIRHKFAIKNTTGYSLNALVDFTDPLDILTHLMIGSEGTLGFIAEITYRTVPEHAHKASALLLFPDIAEACRAVVALKQAPVSAVELMDRASLRCVEDKPGMPAQIRGLADGVTSLLVEARGETAEALAANLAEIGRVLSGVTTLFPPAFTDDPYEYGTLWKIRKGLFPALGAVRKVGTTVIIEDVAFPIESLAAATTDLEHLCRKHGYDEAIIFGHALDGNLHFTFTQDFGIKEEVDRYARFMDEVAELVVNKYDGSLKAEHGTGRNMAPFVEMEWGTEATALMWDIKGLLDPLGLLNPGVLLDKDPRAHLNNLKPLPAADSLVDTCIECGFCERMCPSHGLTLSPRQRITSWREISRRTAANENSDELRRLYDYQGIDTCAACGLCATACPVGIETGRLTKSLRGRRLGSGAHAVGQWASRHYGAAMAATRFGLGAAALVSRLAGPSAMAAMASGLRTLSGGRTPKLGEHLPTAADFAPPANAPSGERVVYFPTCAARTMGPASGDPEKDSLPTVMTRVLARAGFGVVIPDGVENLCCGQAFESKGLQATADAKAAELEAALFKASDHGRLPIVMDASACAWRMKTYLGERLKVVDSVEFLHDAALPRLSPTPQDAPVLVHVNCGARKQGLDDKMVGLAKACAKTAIVPEAVGCCGFAGDKGFTNPELNDHALRHLAPQVPQGCEAGYSSNRTCEIGLADHADVPYRSIVYLLDRTTR